MARKFSKGMPRVRQGYAKGVPTSPKKAKSRWIPAASPGLIAATLEGSEPALAVPVRAAVAVETVTVEVVHAALHHAVHATLHEVAARAVFATAERSAVAGQHGEAPLLALVQGLVERIGGIGDLLQGRRRRPHVLGALAQAGDRILRPVGILVGVLAGIAGTGIHPRIGAVDAQLGEVTYGSLDRRPQLFLVGVELQPGMDGGDPRVDHGGAVFRVHADVAH